ncbi:hypothetical protein BWI95_18900 [Kosakonia cowanii JCM 10956 = DSM 18146]|uniref:Uncharacterized protein n=2 Tax=Kosakonia cowanii TaxID=208223 RepID=A0A807LL77_9ENTR|nr:hypothetical protein BWI95_18900 [Kosakonia cowanii JCM 10956 = DSM 18146]
MALIVFLWTEMKQAARWQPLKILIRGFITLSATATPDALQAVLEDKFYLRTGKKIYKFNSFLK